MGTYKNDWQSPHAWTVIWVDTFTIKDLTTTTILDFQGDGLGSGDLIEGVAGNPAWGQKCVYDTGHNWVTVTHGADQFTIARYSKVGSPPRIACFPPGQIPWPTWPQEEGKGGPLTGASWTAQDGSGGNICEPPAGSESQS
jgi:hypothetical protein